VEDWELGGPGPEGWPEVVPIPKHERNGGAL